MADRQIVYALAIPYETDFLAAQRFTQEGIGLLTQDILGTGPIAAGLACVPTAPASLNVQVNPGRLYQQALLDATAYGQITGQIPQGGLAADTDANHQVVKQGLLRDPVTLACPAPSTAGYSVDYLIEAMFQEVDADPSVLNFFNTANPSTPLAGPGGNGLTLPTVRACQCVVQAKAGIPAATGTQTAPGADAGWIGLYVVTVTYGQTAIATSNIAVLAGAPFLTQTLSQLLNAPGTYCVDTSATPNAITAMPAPALTGYQAGTLLRILPANTNTGAVVANISGLGNASITRPDGTACIPGDIMQGRAFLAVVKSGPSLQMAAWPQSSAAPAKTAISGAAHTYAASDAATSVWRSNGGSPMVDLLPGATGGALASSWSAEIVNADSAALLAVQAGAGSTLAGPNVLNGAIVLGPGQKMTVACDGTNYTCYGAPLRAKLAANATLYVSPTGSDTANTGLTAAATFATLQHAYDWAKQTLDLAGYQLVISIAAGAYTRGAALAGPITGQASSVYLSGAGAANTSITASAGLIVTNGANVLIENVALVATNTPGSGCIGCSASYSGGMSTAFIGPGVSFSGGNIAQLIAIGGGRIVLGNSYTIAGGGACHWYAGAGGMIDNGNTPITVTLTGTPAFLSAFAVAFAGGIINPENDVAFSGAAAGVRYATSSGGIINTNGSGANYLPGNSAGSGSGYY